MKYQHLLVPIVPNAPDQDALDVAFDLATQHSARTTLIYVIEAVEEAAYDEEDELDAFYAHLEANVRRRLQDLSQRFEHAGLAVRPEIVVGRTAQVIVRYSATESVDLIVMRSERVDLNQPEKVLTCLSHQVSMFSQCPVMLLK